MSLNDVRRVKNFIMWRQLSITPHQSNSRIFSTQHAQFRQLTGMETAFNRFQSTTLFSLGYLATTCLQERREPFANSKTFRMLSQTNGMTSPSDSQNQKKPYSNEKHV